MNESSNLVKAIIIYAICVPVAVFIGYQLTNPFTYGTFWAVGALLFLCAFPLMFRYHQLLLVVCFKFSAVVFFIPGRPDIAMFMAWLSLGLSVLQRTLNRHMQFISVPLLTRPFIYILAVVLITAELTGGIGLRTFGGSSMGGRRYIVLLSGIAVYFALTARPIPRDKVWVFLTLYFFGQATTIIGDLFSLVTPSLHFLFWIFPPTYVGMSGGIGEIGTVRLGGTGGVGYAIIFYLLARHGLRNLLDLTEPRKVLRFCFLIFACFFGMFAGFRTFVVTITLTVCVLFFLEGLHRSKQMPRFAFVGGVVALGLILFSSQMPYTIQRSLTVLPLPLQLSQRAVEDAQASKEWRLQIWRAVLPQVPNYLLLGKGYGISNFDFEQAGLGSGSFEENSFTAIAGDYHNGPLSVVMPFGIWGVIGFLWLIVAVGRAVWANYRYGPPDLKNINAFFVAQFITQIIMFFFVFGAFSNDLFQLAGLAGLSVSLNGGVCGSKQQVTSESGPRHAFINIMRRPRPVFQP